MNCDFHHQIEEEEGKQVYSCNQAKRAQKEDVIGK